MQKKYIRWAWLSLILLAFLLLAVLHSLTSGELRIDLGTILETLGSDAPSIERTILFNIRLPRIALGLAVGGALSLSGVVLQGVFRNPLVEPYTLGISGGAAIGVALTIVLGLQVSVGSFMLPVAGFGGALLTIIVVYILSVKKGKIKIQNMLLIGVMISFVASSAMMFLMATTSTENLHGIIFWIMGSLDETNTELIAIVSIAAFVGLFTAYVFAQKLNALRLGEEKARHLGVNTEVAVRVLFVISSLLTGICVSVAGVIGFVGLIIPHLMRLVVGSDFRILLTSSFISGSTFVIFSDTIARTIIAPNELPIGVITGMIGGAVFIAVLSRFKF